MEVKIKLLHPNARVPKYAKIGDAGMDLVAVSEYTDDNSNIIYGTGLAIEIPIGYVGLIFPRSSNSKKDIILTNSVGVIDSGYRGEIMFKFGVYRGKICTNIEVDQNNNEIGSYEKFKTSKVYKIGDRIGQLIIMPYPTIEFTVVDELSDSERGTGGYGSSGR
jgi:dUTP pyrophosphatase